MTHAENKLFWFAEHKGTDIAYLSPLFRTVSVKTVIDFTPQLLDISL